MSRRVRRPRSGLFAVLMGAILSLATPPGMVASVHAADVLTTSRVEFFTRMGAGTALDPDRRWLVVAGGAGDGAGPHTEILDMSGSPTWLRPAILGPTPPATSFDAAVFDSLRDRILFFSPGAGSGVWALSLGAPLTWTELRPTGTKPPIAGAQIVYDALRDRIVGHGGALAPVANSPTVNTSWTLSLGANPAWSPLPTAGGTAPSRAQAVAAFDRAADRMIVFGGSSRTDAGLATDWNDTWALTFAGGIATWNPVATTGTPPPARHAMSAVHDPVRNRLVIGGGAVSGGSAADPFGVFELGLADHAWRTTALPDGPETRWGAMAGYDPARERMLLVGGRNQPAPQSLGDAWELALGQAPGPWTRLVAGGSAPRETQWAGYDFANHRFSAYEEGAVRFMPLEENTWAAIPFVGPPPARAFVRALGQFYDPGSNTFLAFGVDTLYRLVAVPGAAWSRTFIPGAARPPRVDGAATLYHDAPRNRILMFGGLSLGSRGTSSAEFWILTLGDVPQWTKVADTTPLAYRVVPSALDRRRDRLLFSAGYLKRCGLCSPEAVGDLVSLDLPSLTWGVPAATGTPPSPRYFHAAAYDSLRDRLVVTGGLQYGPMPQPGTFYLQFGPGNADGAWSRNDPVGETPPMIVDGPAAVDPHRDRLVLMADALTRYELAWDATPSSVVAECAAPATWPAGSILPLSIGLHQEEGTARRYGWSLEASRNWPGFPLQGFQDLSGTVAVTVPIGVPVPDTAAAGAVALDFVVREIDNPANADTCRSTLVVGFVPSTLSASCPAPAGALPGRDARLDIDLAETGPDRTYAWTLRSRRGWPGFPRTGMVSLPGSPGAVLSILVPVPDSAAAGVVPLDATIVDTLDPANGDSCSTSLRVETFAGFELECPAPLTWQRGQQVVATVVARFGEAGSGVLEWTATSGREWPGLPGGGVVEYEGDVASILVPFTVPDTAGAGTNRIVVTAWLSGSKHDDACTLDLVSPSLVSSAGIHPNPSVARNATLRLVPVVDGVVRYEIRQLATGRAVYKRNLGHLAAARHSAPLVPEGLLPSGVYLVRVVFPDRTVDSKLILLR